LDGFFQKQDLIIMFRFAPSPTGDMHIGNLRVAIFNYIVSKQKNSKLIIRIEDTDSERNLEGKDREILEILQTFGIQFSDVLYQSHNLKFHQQFASNLLQNRRAFLCFCTAEELEKSRKENLKSGKPPRYSGVCETLSDSEVLNMEKPSVVRIQKPDFSVKFRDTLRGEFEFRPEEVDNFVLLRHDKTPTYNFACAIDDMLSDISFIIRGEDHLSNTPKQIAVQHALGYGKEIEFVHLPIILNSDGKKMSKRENTSSIKWLLEEGFIPEAIANYLILLGNKTPKEVFTLEEALEWFTISTLSKSPAKFDIEKLRFINREHLKLLSSEELSKRVGYLDGNIAKIYLEEASTLKELKEKVGKIFENREVDEVLGKAISEMEISEDFGEFKKSLMKRTGLKGKNFFKPLRLLLTGAENGPELSKLYPYLKIYIKDIVK
jgi:glutamyl-tRNA synthetase